MRRPRIGVTSWHHRPRDQEERWEFVPDDYTRWVCRAGGLPLILPMPGASPDLLDDYLAGIDGLLFTGGADIDPAFYGEAVRPRCGQPDRERDEFELGLARRAIDGAIPVLGICRGLQLLNVACGGTLYQDLDERPHTRPEHRSDHHERSQLRHSVRILPGTRLSRIAENLEIKVTSTHHQIIHRLGKRLRPNALGDDGIIEGIEGEGDAFLLAVQWHPERMVDQLAVVESFVDCAAARPSPPPRTEAPE